jgi:hypothetical protein
MLPVFKNIRNALTVIMRKYMILCYVLVDEVDLVFE